MSDLPALRHDVPLAPCTTLAVGGRARYWLQTRTLAQLQAALLRAQEAGWPLLVLGGGSNLVVADTGFNGLVLQALDDHLQLTPEAGDRVHVAVGAGVVWDDLVARTVAAGLPGLACMSGIPGRCGAVVVQNVGAYGQDVAASLVGIWAVERRTGQLVELPAAALELGYRSSRLQGAWRDRYVIWRLHFSLPRQASLQPNHAGLEAALGCAEATPAQLRRAVLALRRAKSMLYSPGDPNHRSCGSFFVNPQVAPATAAVLGERLGTDLPRYPGHAGQVKLSAAWLIERAGFHRGHVAGRVGLSSQHALALINRGGASAYEVVALVRTLQLAVHALAGVTLWPEPVCVGFGCGWAGLLPLPQVAS